MALRVGELFATLGADDRPLRRTLSSAEQAFRGLAKAAAGYLAFKAIGLFTEEIKKSINVTNDYASANLGLKSILEAQGKSFNTAQKFVESYTKDGLVPLADAITAYKSLASRGYNDDQITGTLTRLKDAAAFGRQSSLSIGAAVRSATEGLKNENSLLVDNAGVTKNVAKMWDTYAKSIGTSAQALTQQQKILAEVNGIMEETRFQVGDAAKYADTLGGKLTALSAQVMGLRNAFGSVLAPMLEAILPTISALVARFTQFLTVVAQYSKIIFGAKSVQAQQAKSAANAAKAETALGTATKKAGEKAKKGVAGFDEINQLQEDIAKNAADAASAGGASTGGTIDESANMADPSVNLDSFMGQLGLLKSAISDFYNNWGAKDIVDGIKRGVADFSLENMISKFQTIGLDIIDILNQSLPSVQLTAQSYGRLIGEEMATGLKVGLMLFDIYLDGIIKTLDSNKQPIIDFVKTLTSNMTSAMDDFASVVNTIGIVMLRSLSARREEISNTISNIYGMIIQYHTTIATIISDIVKIFADRIKSFVDTRRQEIQNLSDNLVTIFTSTLDLISKVVTGALDLIAKFWEEWGSRILSKVLDLAMLLGDLFFSIFNDTLVPIWTAAMEALGYVWDNGLSGFIDQVLGFIGRLAELAVLLFEQFIKPIIAYFQEELLPEIKEFVLEAIKVFRELLSSIFSIAENIMKVFNGIIDFLVGAFAGDWKKAWEGVVGVFEGLMKGLGEIFRIPLNVIIQMINSFIDKINSISISIPAVDIPGIGKVGGGTIGFPRVPNIPSIPHFAKGGIISRPTLGMMGEGFKKEAVVPLEDTGFIDLLAGAIGNAVLSAMQFSSGGGNSSSGGELAVYMDTTQVARLIMPKLSSETNRIGKVAIIQEGLL